MLRPGGFAGVVLGGVVLAACQCGPGVPVDGGVADAGATTDAGLDPWDGGTCPVRAWPAPTCAGATFAQRLACVPGLTITETTASGALVHYGFSYTQPVDHFDADAGTFQQRGSIDLVDEQAPVILFTSGYFLWPQRSELSVSWGANQVSYEHRFFAPSRPEPADWTKLTIRQAAADAHDLVTALRWLLPARWVSSGHSKGGMTSLYHRRFHPCDVDGTVAYVAPFSFGAEDAAYPSFLDQVGGPSRASCREALTALQRSLLEDRALFEAMMHPGDFQSLGVDQAFELAVTELSFAFWQYTSPDDPSWGCAVVPAPTASAGARWAFLQHHSSPGDLASDQMLEDFAPYYVQALNELGGPAAPESHLVDLLRVPHADVSTTYLPPSVPLPDHFDSTAMPATLEALQSSGERSLLITGELDPWSANKVSFGHAPDTFHFVAPGDNHAARLATLTEPDEQTAIDAVSRWLGRPLQVSPRLLRRDDLPRASRRP